MQREREGIVVKHSLTILQGDVFVNVAVLELKVRIMTWKMGNEPRGPFLEVPKFYGAFSDVTIPFVSQERRGFMSSNFIVSFLIVTLKTC